MQMVKLKNIKPVFSGERLQQKAGIDYQEVFAPVARLETIRLVLALAAQNNWIVHQMDVKSTFLNVYCKRKYT